MAAVTFSDVHKSYGPVEVIFGIDVTIADGEFAVIVGPSGCGKSTVLRMVAGLEALYPHMSVYGNMSYGLRIQGLRKAKIAERVRLAAEILELGEFLDRKPRQLSGGQRQRVAMGRAIVREPAVFLFDEPLSNLDAKLRVQMRVEIKRLQRRLGTTSIYVTHDQVEAMTLADRLIVMNQGRAEQIGTPLELYQRPATAFVAGFIGSPSMNLIPARLADQGAAVTLGERAKLGLPRTCGGGDGRAVTVGIRPEHMIGADGAAADLELEVDLVEPLGADTLVHGRLEGVAIELTARLPGTVSIDPGQPLPITVDRDHLHLFDPESGARLSD
jgi:sn-glycerol 3-phosphate transport system ATP-binding protein